MIGAEVLDPSAQWGAAGVVLAALTASSYLIVRLIRVSDRQVTTFVLNADRRIKDLERANRRLDRDNRVCSRKLALLIEFLQRHGLAPPPHVMTWPELAEPMIDEGEDDDDGESEPRAAATGG